LKPGRKSWKKDASKIEVSVKLFLLYGRGKSGQVLVPTRKMEHTKVLALVLVIDRQPFANGTKLLLAFANQLSHRTTSATKVSASPLEPLP
jgi:hypothetical protein